MRISIPLVAVSLLAASNGDYAASVAKWRQDYETRLRAEDGWLAVAGLFWLHEGSNGIALAKSTVEFHSGRALLNGKELKPDGDVIKAGDVHLQVIKRADRFGVRVWDPNAATRREFSGLHWFPVNEAYRVTAKFVPYDPPKMIPITNILGVTEPEKCPGYAEFKLQGQAFRLEPVIEEPGKLFFIFRDLTSNHESYGSGRFLKSDMPVNGEVSLDFNEAYNPPCAFTAFATCPLPPHHNRLAVRIEAGEKRYGKH